MSGLYQDGDSGRWRILCRDGSTVYFYRALMEAQLGRQLLPTEHVHHKNGDVADDRLENLEVLDIAVHGALHWPEAAAARRANWQHEWSRSWPACRECSTTDDPHYCTGLCRRCYHRTYMRRRRAEAAA